MAHPGAEVRVPDVRIVVLDVVEVLRDGQPVPLGPPQRRALLAMLAVQRRAWVSATALLDGLYEDGEMPPSGIGLIQTHISALRRALEPERAPRAESTLLQSARGRYRLNITDEQLDLGVFDQLAAQAEQARGRGDLAGAQRFYEQALQLWGGEPLAGVPGPAAANRRTVLRERYLSLLEDSLMVALTLGRTDFVVERARPLAAEHPLRERSTGLLMRALARQGRRSQALDVYAQTRRRLVDELGVEPNSELQELHRRLLHGQSDRAEVPSTPGPVVSRSTELLDRDSQLAAIAAGYEQAGRGAGGLIVVSGYPGAGKTALLTAAAGTVADADLISMSESAGATALFSALARVTGAAAAADTAPAQAQLLAERFAADPRTRLILLDDLDTGDLVSLRLLRALAPILRRLRVLIVAMVDERGWYATEVSELHTELECAAIEVIRLGGLPVTAVAALAERMLGRPVDDRLALEIHQATAGLPLLATALLRDLALLDHPSRVPDHLAGGTYLRALRRQLSRYSPDGGRMLRVIAVLQDYQAPVEVIAAASEQPEHEVAERCALLVTGGILAVADPPRFRHPLPANSLRQMCPYPEVHRIRELAALRARQRSSNARTVARYLRELSGARWSSWVPTLIDAASEAVRDLDLGDAAAYLETAQRISTPEQRDEVLMRLGLVKQWSEPVAARAYLEQALAGQRAAETVPAAVIPLAWTLVSCGQPRAAEELLDEVIGETLARDPEAVTPVRAGRWMIAALTADAWTRYLTDAHGTDAPDRIDSATVVLGDTFSVRTTAQRARAYFLSATGESAAGRLPPELLGIAAHVALWTDELTLAGELSARAADQHFGDIDIYRLVIGSETLLRQSRYADAERLLAVVALTPPADGVRHPPALVAQYAHALLGTGRIDDAERWLDSTRAYTYSDSWEWMVITYVRALICTARGQSRAAVGHFLDIGRRLAAWDLHNPSHIPWRSWAALHLVRLGELEQARELAAAELEFARRWNTPVTVGRALRAVALAAADHTTADTLTTAVTLLRRGESSTELITALIDLADLRQRDGDPAAARAIFDEALDLSRCRNAQLLMTRIEGRLTALADELPAENS